MPIRRFELAQLLVAGCAVVFGLIEIAQAQPGYVPPPTPLPPPVFNPSNPGTVPQPSYRPITPSTPSTAPANEADLSTTASERTRTVHHRHRGRLAGYTLPSYCGSSPCVRIVVAEPPPVYRASVLWWPGYYDYAPGQFVRGHSRYGGYGRRAGYHGD
jgi:hypothetical protein